MMIARFARHPMIERLAFWSGVACIVLIVVLSLKPSVSVGVSVSDKVLHFAAYFVVMGCFGIGLQRISLARLFIAIAGFGVGIEIAQGLMAMGRTFSGYDMLANVAGAACAGLLVWGLVKRYPTEIRS